VTKHIYVKKFHQYLLSHTLKWIWVFVF